MTTLRCPVCGWDASSEGRLDFCFRLVEDLTRERRVLGSEPRGTLTVSEESCELVGEPRLRCGECATEFPAPMGLTVTAVDDYEPDST